MPELDPKDIRQDRPLLVALIAQVKAFLVDYEAYVKIWHSCPKEEPGEHKHH